MTDIGAKIRKYREELGLPQSALAEAVGTSQQTVDRIERGTVENSRFALPILIWIEAEYDRRDLQANFSEVIGRSAGKTLQEMVPSYRLVDGLLEEEDRVSPPPAIKDLAELRGVRLDRGFMGPMGDVIFRAGDYVFIHPTSRPGHFSVCLVGPKDATEGPFEWRVVLDRTELPSLHGEVAAAFAWTDDSERSFFRVAAVFPR